MEITSSPLNDGVQQSYDIVHDIDIDDDNDDYDIVEVNDEKTATGREYENARISFQCHSVSQELQASPILCRGEAISQQPYQWPQDLYSTPVM